MTISQKLLISALVLISVCVVSGLCIFHADYSFKTSRSRAGLFWSFYLTAILALTSGILTLIWDY